jgi:hypothetical protein
MVHAGVHGEDQAAALGGYMVCQPVKLTEGRAGFIPQEEADIVLRSVESADEVRRRLERNRSAGSFGLFRAGRQGEATQGEKGGAQQHPL